MVQISTVAIQVVVVIVVQPGVAKAVVVAAATAVVNPGSVHEYDEDMTAFVKMSLKHSAPAEMPIIA